MPTTSQARSTPAPAGPGQHEHHPGARAKSTVPHATEPPRARTKTPAARAVERSAERSGGRAAKSAAERATRPSQSRPKTSTARAADPPRVPSPPPAVRAAEPSQTPPASPTGTEPPRAQATPSSALAVERMEVQASKTTMAPGAPSKQSQTSPLSTELDGLRTCAAPAPASTATTTVEPPATSPACASSDGGNPSPAGASSDEQGLLATDATRGVQASGDGVITAGMPGISSEQSQTSPLSTELDGLRTCAAPSPGSATTTVEPPATSPACASSDGGNPSPAGASSDEQGLLATDATRGVQASGDGVITAGMPGISSEQSQTSPLSTELDGLRTCAASSPGSATTMTSLQLTATSPARVGGDGGNPSPAEESSDELCLPSHATLNVHLSDQTEGGGVGTSSGSSSSGGGGSSSSSGGDSSSSSSGGGSSSDRESERVLSDDDEDVVGGTEEGTTERQRGEDDAMEPDDGVEPPLDEASCDKDDDEHAIDIDEEAPRCNDLGGLIRRAKDAAEGITSKKTWIQWGSARRQTRRAPKESKTEEPHYVEALLDRLVDRKTNEDGVVLYRAEWAEYEGDDDRYTWEPVEHLEGHEDWMELVDLWKDKYNEQQSFASFVKSNVKGYRVGAGEEMKCFFYAIEVVRRLLGLEEFKLDTVVARLEKKGWNFEGGVLKKSMQPLLEALATAGLKIDCSQWRENLHKTEYGHGQDGLALSLPEGPGTYMVGTLGPRQIAHCWVLSVDCDGMLRVYDNGGEVFFNELQFRQILWIRSCVPFVHRRRNRRRRPETVNADSTSVGTVAESISISPSADQLDVPVPTAGSKRRSTPTDKPSQTKRLRSVDDEEE